MGVIAVTAGGVFLAGATAVLLVRHSDIQSIEAACPGGTCPVSKEAQLTSTRDRALVEGPLAIGVGSAGLVAAGLGIYLLAVKPASNTAPAQAAVTPWVGQGGGGLAWGGSFW